MRIKGVDGMTRDERLSEIQDLMDSVAALICGGATDRALRNIVRGLRARDGVTSDDA